MSLQVILHRLRVHPRDHLVQEQLEELIEDLRARVHLEQKLHQYRTLRVVHRYRRLSSEQS